MHVMTKLRKHTGKFNLFSENVADHSKFRLLTQMFKLLNPDPHSEAGSGSRGHVGFGSAKLFVMDMLIFVSKWSS